MTTHLLETREKQRFSKTLADLNQSDIRLKVATLKQEILDKKFEIEQIAPQAALEDAMRSYNCDPMSHAGKGDEKRRLQIELERLELQHKRAVIMDALLSAVSAYAASQEYQKAYQAVLARMNEDAQCAGWIRYQRGERPVLPHGFGSADPVSVRAFDPGERPSPERIAAYQALEAELRDWRTRGGVTSAYTNMVVAHPENREIVEHAELEDLTERACA